MDTLRRQGIVVAASVAAALNSHFVSKVSRHSGMGSTNAGAASPVALTHPEQRKRA